MLEPGANLDAGTHVDRTVIVLPLTPERFGDLAVLFRTGTETRWCWYHARIATGEKAP